MNRDLKILRTCDAFEPEVLSEVIQPEREVIDEKSGARTILPAVKKLMMKGILQRADALNQNGRVYPHHLLEREVRNYQKFIIENRAVGELDHPPESVISLKNVSHIVREATLNNGVVTGTIEVLGTPSGKILQSLVESGVKIGISSRGVGTTKKQGDYQVVQDDFQLICWDIVSEPSTPGAFILPEGKTISRKELSNIFKRSDAIDRVLNDILSMKEMKAGNQ